MIPRLKIGRALLGGGGEVGSGAEASAGSGDDEDFRGVVVLGGFDDVEEFVNEAWVDGVEAFGAVESDDGDAVLVLEEEFLIVHAPSTSLGLAAASMAVGLVSAVCRVRRVDL